MLASHSCFCSFFHQSSLYPIKIFEKCVYLLVIIIIITIIFEFAVTHKLHKLTQTRLQITPSILSGAGAGPADPAAAGPIIHKTNYFKNLC